ncbi:MAG: family 10 glycosylhydrolase [Melioribacteraceae bacterium]|nr:family 10 glycosylhydrolase [Melioribacteraceae bacterium]
MRKLFYSIQVLLIFSFSIISSQTTSPKREFRGTWIASVSNIDWPSSTTLSVETLKQNLIDMLDAIKDANLNAAFFQVRPECDALYKSDFEPWSYWLTGTQGKAPVNNFDPLQFAIDEAHKRGIELHAWLNPYRARHAGASYDRSATHISNTKPEWILKFGNLHILNPGLPAVRDYNVSIVVDIITKYDVDGIHFDDYFYPYPPDHMKANSTNNAKDESTFLLDPRGFTNKDEWRRDNVNIQMKAISDTINALKPNVKFGISPFGIWKAGVPAGITGMDAYSAIYADPMNWLKNNTVDYIIPQLYWKIGGSQDYNKLMPWWADSAKHYNKHYYTGNIYGSSYTSAELPNQLKANRNNSKTDGMVLFSAKHIPGNTSGFTDSLKTKYYTNPAIIPGMNWKDQVKPNKPTNLRFEKIAGVRGDGLIWDKPAVAADGNLASMYAIYKFNTATVQPSQIEDASNLNNIVGVNYAALKVNDVSSTMYFAVTSLDKNYNESELSEVIPVTINIPEKPKTFYPADLAVNQKDTIKFIWENTKHSNYNRLQVSEDINFSSLVFNQNNIVDTFRTVTRLKGLKTYYWRVSASNLAGESVYSETKSFTTGFPAPPQLLLPADKSVDVSVTPKLVWNKTFAASYYRLQVAEGLSILPTIIIIDTVTTDTTLTIGKLKENKIYTWSVLAGNDYGKSELAEVMKFRTLVSTSVLEDDGMPKSYQLNQNYPNPFNPSTKIKYALPESGLTSIKIFNVLGQEIAEIVNEEMSKGYHSIEFNAENLPSGIYIYTLQSNSHVLSKKMMFVK